MSNLPNRDIARRKAENIVRLLRYKPKLSLPTKVSISIGLVFCEKKAVSYQELFEEADKALYLAKTSGRGQYAEAGLGLPDKIQDSVESVGLICSRNLDIYTAFHCVENIHMKLLEIMNGMELDRAISEYADKIKAVYVDLTVKDTWEKDMLEKLKTDIKKIGAKVIAICDENDMEAYGLALQYGVQGILSAPLNHMTVSRRFHQDMK